MGNTSGKPAERPSVLLVKPYGKMFAPVREILDGGRFDVVEVCDPEIGVVRDMIRNGFLAIIVEPTVANSVWGKGVQIIEEAKTSSVPVVVLTAMYQIRKVVGDELLRGVSVVNAPAFEALIPILRSRS